MSATIFNLQRKVSLDINPLADFVNSLFEKLDEVSDKSAAIAFVSDRRMTELNKFFRGKDTTTDVLSFPHEPDVFFQNASLSSSEELDDSGALNENFLGDIVISAEQAARQANENQLTLENEIKQLILHGLLHLSGYDHEVDNGEMNRRELELRDKLGI
jgi:probable rRNA maturation factor